MFPEWGHQVPFFGFLIIFFRKLALVLEHGVNTHIIVLAKNLALKYLFTKKPKLLNDGNADSSNFYHSDISEGVITGLFEHCSFS